MEFLPSFQATWCVNCVLPSETHTGTRVGGALLGACQVLHGANGCRDVSKMHQADVYLLLWRQIRIKTFQVPRKFINECYE
jgi:hypothetical protein